MILVDVLNFPFKEFLTDNNIYYMDKPYTLMGHGGCTQNYPCSDKQTVKDVSERKTQKYTVYHDSIPRLNQLSIHT